MMIHNVAFTDSQLAAVMAGLRLLQRFQSNPRTCVLTDASGTPSWSAAEAIEDVASASGAHDCLGEADIDRLCEQLNCIEASAPHIESIAPEPAVIAGDAAAFEDLLEKATAAVQSGCPCSVCADLRGAIAKAGGQS